VAEFINNLSGDDTVVIPDPAEAERKRKEAEEKVAKEKAEAERKRKETNEKAAKENAEAERKQKEAKTKAEKEKKSLKGKGVNIITTRKKRRIKSLLKKYWWMAAVLVAIVAIVAIWLMVPFQKGENPKASYSNGILTVNGIKYNMVWVEGGTFSMGATPEQGVDVADDEKPVHSVTLSGYYIGKTEVTQALWKAVMGTNPSLFKGDNLPVECVSWDDCQVFIRKLNSLTGQNFRLPTEAEWEFACRGGNNSRGYKYSGSNYIDNVAWYWDNSGIKYLEPIFGKLRQKTHPVATKAPNELGIYDMTGNVCEWCNDWYGDYRSDAQTNPKGLDNGSGRVLRGGSWAIQEDECRSSSRLGGNPINPDPHRIGIFGLRLSL
jgi:formylglycine-generating enzyme required for sulfatase activity